MDPIELWPVHGPDPDRPEDPFESGGQSYLVMVLPVGLSHWWMLSLFNTMRPVLGSIYEEIGGAVARRFDPRCKLVVYRGTTTLGQGWRFIHGEVYPDLGDASGARLRMLSDWSDARFADALPLGRRAARAELKAKKRQVVLTRR